MKEYFKSRTLNHIICQLWLNKSEGESRSQESHKVIKALLHMFINKFSGELEMVEIFKNIYIFRERGKEGERESEKH